MRGNVHRNAILVRSPGNRQWPVLESEIRSARAERHRLRRRGKSFGPCVFAATKQTDVDPHLSVQVKMNHIFISHVSRKNNLRACLNHGFSVAFLPTFISSSLQKAGSLDLKDPSYSSPFKSPSL